MSRCAKVLYWALGTLGGVCSANPGGALGLSPVGNRETDKNHLQSQSARDTCMQRIGIFMSNIFLFSFLLSL